MQAQPQRLLGRLRAGNAAFAVGPRLDQFDIVIGELPEQGLGALESSGVVVVVEGLGCFIDEVSQPSQKCPVDGFGDGCCVVF